MTISASAAWIIGLKKNLVPFGLFWVTHQSTTKEVAILNLTLTTKEKRLYHVEDGGAFEDSDRSHTPVLAAGFRLFFLT